MTNYERIRSMSMPQMAEFIERVEWMDYPFEFCEHCPHWDEQEKECSVVYAKNKCPDYTMLDWLSWEEGTNKDSNEAGVRHDVE